MNIIYFCNVHRTAPTELGVLKKVQDQCIVLRNEGHNVYLACLDNHTKYVVLDNNDKEVYSFKIDDKSRFTRDAYIFCEIERFATQNGVGILYSRYSNFSYGAHKFYSRLKKQGIKCLLEIPTYPLSQRWTAIKQNIKRGNIIRALIQTYDSTVGSTGILFFKNSLNRIVNNNGFPEIWHIPVLPITNGIDVSSIPHRDHDYVEAKSHILVASVANIARWHGFDRFIKGLHEYYKKDQKVHVTLELAGPGLEVEMLKALTAKLNVEQYVKFLGPTTGEALDKLYERADIGISILGIHRNNMTTIDCLKSREYCARRLPFITQSAEKHFDGTSFALQFPSDESPVNIEEVVKFYRKISNNEQILKDMYVYATEKCDWKIAFKNVVDYVNTIDNGKDI